MNARRHTGRKAIAADVWRLMAGFTMATMQRGRHVGILRELGLTPGHLKLLGVLRPDEPRPMGMVAEAVGCDPSMATWLVDRLEERGLVERKMLATDRRVKTVTLTSLGMKTKGRLFDHLYDPPDELLALDTATLESLREALGRLPIGAQPPWAPLDSREAAAR